MSFEDDVRKIVREEVRRYLCETTSGMRGRDVDVERYNEFVWKDRESFEFLCRTGQYLNI